jgi:hypothetical protein
MDLIKDIQDAQKARELSENPIFIEVFEAIEREAFSKWKTMLNEKDRETLWSLNLGMQVLKGKLTEMTNGGKIAQKELDRQNKASEQDSAE